MKSRVSMVAYLALALAACSSSSSSPAPAGSGGSSSGGPTGAGGGGIAGITTITCNRPADMKCTLHGAGDQKNIDDEKASCTSNGGSLVDHCPSAGLAGCCLIVGYGDCYYDASMTASIMSACGSGWTTKAPLAAMPIA